MIENIKEAWGWVGAEPVEIVATNEFGNVLFTDRERRYWRLCPEDLTCTIIAQDDDAFRAVRGDPDFQVDWGMEALVSEARAAYGKLGPGRCYCLKMPAPLGGAYDASNLGTVDHLELIAFSGDVARQIKDLPDGAKVRVRTL